MLKETSKPGSKVNKTKSLFIDKIWRIEAKFKNFINLATPLTNLKHTHVRPIKVKRRHNSGKTKEAFSSLGLSIKHPYGVLCIWNFSIAFVVFFFLFEDDLFYSAAAQEYVCFWKKFHTMSLSTSGHYYQRFSLSPVTILTFNSEKIKCIAVFFCTETIAVLPVKEELGGPWIFLIHVFKVNRKPFHFLKTNFLRIGKDFVGNKLLLRRPQLHIVSFVSKLHVPNTVPIDW